MVVELKHDIGTLQEVLERCEAGIAGFRAQIEATQGRLSNYTDKVRECDEQEESANLRMSEAEEAVTQAEEAVKQARMAALLNEGLQGESSSLKAKNDAEIDLSRQRTNITTARMERSKLEKKLAKERETLLERQSQDRLELEQLQEQLSHLETIYSENHDTLGQALYDELTSHMEESRETVENLARILSEHRAELISLEHTVVAKLTSWPGLARQMQREIDKTLPVPEPTGVRLSRAAIAYLEALTAEGPELRGTRAFPSTALPRLFDFNGSTVTAARKLDFATSAQSRKESIQEFIRQLKQEENERAWSVQRYNS